MSHHPASITRLFTTSALAVGLCAASPSPAQAAQPMHTITNFTIDTGTDLGNSGYPHTATNEQCRGTFQILSDDTAHVTKVTVLGKTSPKPARAVVHRPGNPDNPRTPTGTAFDWQAVTHGQDGTYLPTGTWVVILSKPATGTCAEAYDGSVHVKIDGL